MNTNHDTAPNNINIISYSFLYPQLFPFPCFFYLSSSLLVFILLNKFFFFFSPCTFCAFSFSCHFLISQCSPQRRARCPVALQNCMSFFSPPLLSDFTHVPVSYDMTCLITVLGVSVQFPCSACCHLFARRISD